MSLEGSYTSLDRKVHNLETSLRHSLSDVSSKLSEVEDAVDQLEGIPRRVDSLEYDLREAKEETERVESDLDDRISEVDGSVDRLTTRVAALERYLRQAEGAVVVDLDEDRGGELHALTVTVNKGLAAQAGLLPDYERTRLKLAGDHLKHAREERGRHRAAVLRAAAVLATTQASDAERKAAERDFKESAPKAQQAHSRIGPLTTSAEAARQKLEADDVLRAKNAKAIEAGQRANTKLRLRLRSRLSDALSGAELLPVWFVTALGPMAPSRNANDWMDAATDVLAYRVTYQITDPVVALGTPPDGHRTSRRTAWHQELTRELRRWG
ncbi:CopG family transcriptional regulator [Streptomyces sp. HUAS TT20]|uniref:CopG family transcriptional regulator n=1 Tax=Streptomyces sp. HUAS TT20 TaxID=3447509 RepID=UPI0021DA46F5|nr:CopG family transcriptional regulator [Streptomyces sp. HUAS 15-9]UXY33255.1 CopG family transcriptional regulator [Streptomyces sp. HUAS 15-9]